MNDYRALQAAQAAILSAKKLKPAGNLFDDQFLHAEKGETHCLQYENLWATFTCLPNHPDLVIIRTTYWRAENEVKDVYQKEDARELYKRLLEAGFKPEGQS